MAATDKLVITEKNSRHSVAGTCLKIAIDILGLLTAAVIIFFLYSLTDDFDANGVEFIE